MEGEGRSGGEGREWKREGGSEGVEEGEGREERVEGGREGERVGGMERGREGRRT